MASHEARSSGAEPCWLDPEEMRLWRGFIEVSIRMMQVLDAGLKTDSGLTLDDYEVLVHLSESPDHRLRMTDLSERLLHSQSRLTQRTDRLSNRGLVRREKCEVDRRGTWAVITDAGMEAITAAAPGHVNDVRRYLVDLVEPGELSTMVDVYERLACNLRKRARA